MIAERHLLKVYDVAVALGYVGREDAELTAKLDHVRAVLAKVVA